MSWNGWSGCLDSSVAHRRAVLARVGAADQDAAPGVESNRLVAAEATTRPDEPMPLGFERAADRGADLRLECNEAAVGRAGAGRVGRALVAEPGGVARLLHVHSEVDHVAEHLRVPLRLHVAPHQSEAQPGVALLGDE